MAFDYNKVKVHQLQKADAILKGEDSDLEKDIQIVQAMLGITEQQVDDLPIEKFNEIRAVVYSELSKQKEQLIPQRVFKIGTRIFKINLNIKTLPASTLRDMQILEVSDKNYIEKMHLILALFCKEEQPIWCKWRKDLDYDQKAELFRTQMSAKIALNLSLFFCEVFKRFYPAIQTYLKKQMSKMNKELDASLEEILKAFPNIGDGILQSTS